MRERLREMIFDGYRRCDWGDKFCDKIADHLLANGVIILPVKLGQTVWVIGTKCMSGEYDEFCENNEFYECEDCLLNKELCVFMRDVSEYLLGCIASYENPFFVWGKTVFATREEAEQALAERNEHERTIV